MYKIDLIRTLLIEYKEVNALTWKEVIEKLNEDGHILTKSYMSSLVTSNRRPSLKIIKKIQEKLNIKILERYEDGTKTN